MKSKKLTNMKATTKVALAFVAIGWMCWNVGNTCYAQTPPADLSPDLQEVVRLSQAHQGDDVIVNYIRNTGKSYKLSADDIIYLNAQGVSQGVIIALQTATSGGSPADQNPPAPTSSPVEQTAPAAPSIETPAPTASPQPDASIPVAVAPASLQVPANVPWFDTGIDISAGELVSITASGLVLYKPGGPYVTPAGEPLASRNGIAPGLPVSSLVGKVSRFGMPFAVGMGSSFISPVGGRLYLSMNDCVGCFGDNSGSWSVTVNLGQASPQPVVNLIYFQSQLAPYGNWVNLPGYGLCWQPVVNADWRPYYDGGHWEYTDAGWYWQSDYPWGDIAFHYGRWVYASFGDDPSWVWVPGYDYAPAWVIWRHADTDGYIGWAPLPPGAVFVNGGWEFNHVRVGVDFAFGLGDGFFTFVAYDHLFFDPHLYPHGYRQFIVPRDRLALIYRHSLIENRYRLDHGRFVNEGLSRDRMAALTHREDIRPMAVQDLKQREEQRNVMVRRDDIRNFRPGTTRPNAARVVEPRLQVSHNNPELSGPNHETHPGNNANIHQVGNGGNIEGSPRHGVNTDTEKTKGTHFTNGKPRGNGNGGNDNSTTKTDNGH